MRPEHLDLLEQCGMPTLNAEGTLAIVSIIRPDLERNDYVGGLWSVPLDESGPPRLLTRGYRDTAPAISPDGQWLAFLRAEQKGKPQLHLLALGCADPVALTDNPLGAGAPHWSPDSRRIAFSARVPEPGRYGTDEDTGPEAEAPRLITTLAYRVDQVGFTNDRRNHLFVLEVPDLNAYDPPDGSTAADADDGGSRDNQSGRDTAQKARQITDGDCDDVDVAWSPDGSRLVFVSDRDPDGSVSLREDDLTSSVFTCTPDGEELTLVAGGQLSCSGPQWTADGEQIVFLAQELGEQGIEFVARNGGLYVVPSPGPAASPDASTGHRRLTDAETLDLGEDGTHLSVSRRGVLVQDRRRGTVRLLEIDPNADPVDAESAVEISGGLAWHRGHAVTADGDTVVASVSGADRPSELVLVRGGTGAAPRRLTDASRRLLEAVTPRPLLERVIAGADGYPVHGWVVLPDPDLHGPGPYPVLLNIHGGPFSSYVPSFFDEPQVFAGAGYAVLMCNPRGSAGYGQAHGAAIKGRLGSVDADDILAFLDGCLADPELLLDVRKVGVMGGSYGGFMTAWLTTRTDRFAAAIVERGYVDALSFVGSADIGWFFPDQYHRSQDRSAAPSSDPDAELREQSPITYVDRVTTPTMVIHSEEDWRTPIEQGQRWYVALRRKGVPAQLLIFPGEGHELSRSGRPTHRRDRFHHILRWWSEHLPVKWGDDGLVHRNSVDD